MGRNQIVLVIKCMIIKTESIFNKSQNDQMS